MNKNKHCKIKPAYPIQPANCPVLWYPAPVVRLYCWRWLSQKCHKVLFPLALRMQHQWRGSCQSALGLHTRKVHFPTRRWRGFLGWVKVERGRNWVDRGQNGGGLGLEVGRDDGRGCHCILNSFLGYRARDWHRSTYWGCLGLTWGKLAICFYWERLINL